MRLKYNNRKWIKLAKAILSQYPMCALCGKIGRDTPATVVDHIKPHKGDYDLFWSVDNLQALCKTCHDSQKRQQEINGYSQACGVDGYPIDGGHPWGGGK